MDNYKRNPNTSCIICSEPIYKRPGELKENKGRVFCSTKCYGIACRKEKPCIVCGKMMMKSLNKKTCSRSCSNKNREGIKYKGRALKDKVKAYKMLKLRLFKKRGNSCERCSFNKFEILVIHHKDRNREHNDLDNLELICPNCHAEEHYFKKSWLKKLIN